MMQDLFSPTMIDDLKAAIEICMDERDLAHMTADQARQALLDMVAEYHAETGPDPRNAVIIRFPLADGTGKETLFQPVARFLAEATRRGDVLMSRPLPQDLGGGFYLRINPVTGETLEP